MIFSLFRRDMIRDSGDPETVGGDVALFTERFNSWSDHRQYEQTL